MPEGECGGGADSVGSKAEPLICSRRRDGTFAAALVALLLGPVLASAEVPSRVRFVDDQNKPVASPLEVCFDLAQRSDCVTVAAGEAATAPEGFLALRAEGADHGPARALRSDLPVGPDGTLRLVVERKALLRLGGARRPSALTVSLYPPEDATFRQPALRRTLAPGGLEVKIPAGSFVLALAAPGLSPDLHLLVARPGATTVVAYNPRPGWALIVRCRGGARSATLSQAAVDLVATPGYGRAPQPIGSALSESHGLALFSGITAALAGVTVRHAAFLAAEGHGIAAATGSFAVYDAELLQGGRLNATVSLHGRPVVAAGCSMDLPKPATPEHRSSGYDELWSGKSDARGVCRSAALLPGVYRATVQLPEATSTVFRWVTIEEGRDTQEDIALAPTQVTGSIRRGGAPAPGYKVQAYLLLADRPSDSAGASSATATSDDDGKYTLSLWTAGRYFFSLRSPADTAVATGHKELATEGDRDEKVDFDLASSSVTGTVTDEAGAPIGSAFVAVAWQEGNSRTFSDDQGHFAVDVQGAGSGTVFAGKPGYRRSAPQAFQVSEDQPLPPVTLVLKRQVTATASLVSAAGAPVAGAWVASIAVTADGPAVFATTRSAADGSFEIGTPPGPRRIFVSGADCPLSAFALPDAPRADSADGGDSDGDGDGGGDADAAEPLVCPAAPASFLLTLVDEQGKAVPYASLILQQDGNVVPRDVLATHLQLLGLPASTDGAGRLVVPYLAPGGYDPPEQHGVDRHDRRRQPSGLPLRGRAGADGEHRAHGHSTGQAVSGAARRETPDAASEEDRRRLEVAVVRNGAGDDAGRLIEPFARPRPPTNGHGEGGHPDRRRHLLTQVGPPTPTHPPSRRAVPRSSLRSGSAWRRPPSWALLPRRARHRRGIDAIDSRPMNAPSES
jgi:Carboxypeptidase regulatory-like domain